MPQMGTISLNGHSIPLEKVAEPAVVTDIKIADGVFVRQGLVKKAGTILAQHSHKYDHLTLIAQGSVRVWVDGLEMGTFNAPHSIKIVAGRKHSFATLTDNVLIYCVHNIERGGEVEIEDEHDPFAVEAA